MQLSPTKPPAHLGKDGRKWWLALVAEYSIRDAAGLALVGTACECLDRLREAQAAVEKTGALVIDRYGAPKLSPALALEKTARDQMLAALKMLNLDVEPLRDGPGRPAGG
jgi:P27 family predicted phage terminase small subunit